MKKQNKTAFSLAEVLITLGIIGIVAALTLPNLRKEEQQQSMLTKLKKAYSVMNQAVKLSESTSGSSSTWNYGAVNDTNPATMEKWFNDYLESFMKHSEVTLNADSITVELQDGTDVDFHRSTGIDIIVYLNGRDKSYKAGRDIFYFQILPSASGSSFAPYSIGSTGTGRDKWIDGTYGCSKANTTIANRKYCTGLIIFDQWQLGDDYPW